MNASIKAFLSERAVAVELMARGFIVYEPIIDIYGCDLLINKNSNFLKIQIKSSYKTDGKYTFNCHYGKYANKSYTEDMVDFFILYIVQHECFYIIPSNIILSTSGHIHISLHEMNKYQIYNEAWNLLEE